MNTRSIRLVATLAILVAVAACSPDSIPGPLDRADSTLVIARKSDSTLLAGLNVSGPVANASPAGAASAHASYVSLLPGTFSEGTAATVTNLRTAQHLTVAIVDGGFDPQPLPASLDDTVQVTVSFARGSPDATAYVVVARMAPRIVRTRPPRSWAGVALNTVIAIVFTEPVDPASVNASSITLSAGTSLVAGEVRVLSATGYTVEFAPSASLAPLTTYTLKASPAVTNLAGTSLVMSQDVTFTTVQSYGSGPVVSVTVSPDSATVNEGEELLLTAMLVDSAGRTAIASYQSVVWTSSAPDVVTVLGGGWVVGIGAGTAVITARSDNGHTGTARIAVNPIAVGAIVTTTCDDYGQCGMFAVDPDGSNGRYLTASDGDIDPVWSPDGTSIAFRSQRRCDRTTTRICHNDLFVMKSDGSGIGADGSGLRSLTTGSGLDVGGMSWSPDGRRIVFAGAVFPTDLYPREALYIMNADGSGLRLLVSGPPGGSASWPDWSPDGGKIAYNIIVRDTSAINIIDADGSNNVRISTPSASRGDLRPHWSPDGKRIAFTREWYPDLNGASSQVFLMDADGSNVTQVTHDSRGALNPAWSPDGTKLALIAWDLTGLGVVNADGSGGRPIAYGAFSAPSWRRAAARASRVTGAVRARP